MDATFKQLILKITPSDLKSGLTATVVTGTLIFLLAEITTPYMATAATAYLLLLFGVLFHSKRKTHILLMSLGVLIDLSLVVILETNRSAIATALGGELNVWQKGHIIFSSLAVTLYVPTILIGVKAALAPASTRHGKSHVYFGRVAFLCRTGGFLLMFSLLEQVSK